jgi:hypothetical protein
MERGSGGAGVTDRTCYHETAAKAGVTQLVEYLLPKQKVAGSSPVSRSKITSPLGENRRQAKYLANRK